MTSLGLNFHICKMEHVTQEDQRDIGVGGGGHLENWSWNSSVHYAGPASAHFPSRRSGESMAHGDSLRAFKLLD